jgi:AcrR family transcriptional regulator
MGVTRAAVREHCASDEALQLAVLDADARLFAERVFYPAFKKPRGLRRLEAFLENWLKWNRAPGIPGGCVFIVSSIHWADDEGPVRSALIVWFEQMYEALRRAIQQAVEEGELRADTDLEQFASDLHALAMKYHHDVRLVHRPDAAQRARVSFFRLVKSARVSPSSPPRT